MKRILISLIFLRLNEIFEKNTRYKGVELNKIAKRWASLKDKYGHRRMTTIAYLLMIGVTSLTIHILFVGGLGHSGLLFMLIPYSVSLLIALVQPNDEAKTMFGKYLRHMTTAILVFLATSVVLREGFVCVILFFPIYFIFTTFAYLIRGFTQDKTKLRTVVMPSLILVLSLEGTSELLTIERSSSVRISKQTTLSVSQVKSNLATPFDLDKKRHWLLAIFPMPYHIEAGSLNAGDVHKIKTRYHRWFVTNTHEGEAELLIEHVGPESVRTKLLSDTTYFSSYLAMHGTQIQFKPLESGGTEITLQIDFERKLDPAWYFQPVQELGISKMAEFLIDEVMIREDAEIH